MRSRRGLAANFRTQFSVSVCVSVTLRFGLGFFRWIRLKGLSPQRLGTQKKRGRLVLVVMIVVVVIVVVVVVMIFAAFFFRRRDFLGPRANRVDVRL
jgi:heme/copper-type cytochrome/quinol oxidase subunit 2